MIPVKLKGIVFDKDGVLVDFDRTWIKMLLDMAEEWAGGDEVENTRLLETAGYDAGTGTFYSGSVWAAGNTDDLVGVWDVTGETVARLKLKTFIDQRCFDAEIIPMFPPSQLLALFRKLSDAGLNLGLTTNDVEASAKRTMDDFGLSTQMSLILGYDSVANPKPAADPVLAFCKHNDLKPNQMAVVGDNVHDMEMAIAADVAVRIGVLSGNASAEELGPVADYLLDSVMDLPRLLVSEKLIEAN